MRARKLLVITSVLAMLIASVPAQALAAKPTDTGARHVNRADVEGQRVTLGTDKLIGQPPIGPSKVGPAGPGSDWMTSEATYYLKNYTTRAVREHVEVWVARTSAFPSTDMLNPLTADPADTFAYDDCRNDELDRITVTDEQAQYRGPVRGRDVPGGVGGVLGAAEPQRAQGSAADVLPGASTVCL